MTLAERFAEAGLPALAIDWFGRTAGLPENGTREQEFDWQTHIPQVTPAGVDADVTTAVGHLRERTRPDLPVVTVGERRLRRRPALLNSTGRPDAPDQHEQPLAQAAIGTSNLPANPVRLLTAAFCGARDRGRCSRGAAPSAGRYHGSASGWGRGLVRAWCTSPRSAQRLLTSTEN